jgi:hypothetical protein
MWMISPPSLFDLFSPQLRVMFTRRNKSDAVLSYDWFIASLFFYIQRWPVYIYSIYSDRGRPSADVRG